MAKVLYGGGVSAIRGTVGGSTYSANRSGSYVKSWSRGANPRTVLQTAPRSRLSLYGIEWRGLTQSQRDDWDTYAAAAPQAYTDSLGQTYYTTGYAWYSTVNQWRFTLGNTLRDTYPTVSAPAAPAVPVLTFQATADGSSYATFASAPFGTDDGVFFLSVSLSQGRTAMPLSTYRMIKTVSAPDANTVFTFSNLTDLFGTIPSDARAFLRVHLQTTQGRRGPACATSGDS